MTTEVDRQDQPNFDTRQDAKHWEITKFTLKLFQVPSPPTPTHRKKVNAEQGTPFIRTKLKWTGHMVPKVPVFKCTPPTPV